MECICLFCGRSLSPLYSNIRAVYRTSKNHSRSDPTSCYYIIGEDQSIYHCGIRDIETNFPRSYNNDDMDLTMSSIRRIVGDGHIISNSFFDYQLELDLKGVL